MFIKTINKRTYVYENLFTKTFIKIINDLKTLIIKAINNDYKRIKTIKKTLISRC